MTPPTGKFLSIYAGNNVACGILLDRTLTVIHHCAHAEVHFEAQIAADYFSAGEVVTLISVTFPCNYPSSKLALEPITFAVSVRARRSSACFDVHVADVA